VTTAVTDARSNFNDQIAHAVNVLKRSARLQAMFDAICSGGKKPKTVEKLMTATGFSQVVVLQLGGWLADQQLVQKVKVKGQRTTYGKDRFYAANRAKIRAFIKDPQKLKRLSTKVSPKGGPVTGNFRVSVAGARVQIAEVTCEDFEQFAKAGHVKSIPNQSVSESAFKKGVQKLIGETGSFQDWGGERNDLYTSKIRLKGQRRSVAFAFKGPGTKGVLTPRKLGKNGNQIQRLFLSPAEVFIVQYHGQIDQDVIQQMQAFATLNSVREGKRIWYGVIDGDDTRKLLAAYPKQFGLKKS
jgi:hypothetical protein